MRIIHTFHKILKLIQIVENPKRRYKISANEKHETNSLFTSPKKTNQHLINVKMVDYLISSSKRIGSNNNNPTNSQVFKISYQVGNQNCKSAANTLATKMKQALEISAEENTKTNHIAHQALPKNKKPVGP